MMGIQNLKLSFDTWLLTRPANSILEFFFKTEQVFNQTYHVQIAQPQVCQLSTSCLPVVYQFSTSSLPVSTSCLRLGYIRVDTCLRFVQIGKDSVLAYSMALYSQLCLSAERLSIIHHGLEGSSLVQGHRWRLRLRWLRQAENGWI